MSQEHLLSVDDNGNLVYIYSDELKFLEELGAASTARASHVEPTTDGRWTADMSPSGGPILGPFNLRTEALAAETDWIKENVLQ